MRRTPPPPRDPRMERRDGADPVGPSTILVVPSAPHPVRHHLPLVPVGGRYTVAVGVVAGVLLAAVLLLWPRATAYPALLEQNLALKTELQAIQHRMDEVDRITERLRVYDAQLRSLTEAKGPHGPLPPTEVMSNGSLLEHYQDLEDDVRTGASVLAAEDVLESPDLAPLIARPAAGWARGVADRVDDFVDLWELSEAELAALMADVETLGAIQRALPQAWPAEGRLTSGYGWRRDPLRRYTKFHSGIDIANSTGTSLHAVADGVVVTSRYQNGYGNVVEIDHGFGIVTKYAHCSRRRVREGDVVEEGDLVAIMGSTGRSTGPHVHFELRIDGNAQDPLRYLPR
ncbi:MAG: M23 family metallopeptidase [Alphaproteobacteria bacterium]|nr:M23 family metallopeptidase [Alphaproteobacteria bacterium]